MFGALNQGATLYVLDKTGTEPKLCIATVTAKTETPMAGAMWPQPMPNATTDVTVSFADGTTSTFQKLPAGGSVYAYDKAVVTETREQMQTHIENAIRQSRTVIESVGYHQNAIAAYESMMKQLSPSYAKEKETDERLSILEKGILDIKGYLAQMASGASSSKNKN